MTADDRESGSSRSVASVSPLAEKFGVGCLILFLLPFCIVGVRAAIGAAAAAMRGDWGSTAFNGIFAVMFGGAGFGTLWVVIKGRAALRRALPLAAERGANDQAGHETRSLPHTVQHDGWRIAATSPIGDPERDVDEEVYRQPPASRIYVDVSRRGTAVTFPAARNPGAVGCMVAFFGVGAAVTWLLLSLDLAVPDALKWIVVLVDALVLFLVLRVLFGSSYVEASPDGMTVSRRTFGLGTTKRIDARELSAIVVTQGWRAGSTTYSDIRAVTAGGTRVVLGKSIRDEREAEWIADEIWRAVQGGT